MSKFKKVIASIMLLFTLSGQLAPSVNVFAEEVSKTEVSSSRETKEEQTETSATKESTEVKEATEKAKQEDNKKDETPEIGESQNSNDSPEIIKAEEKDINEQLAEVLDEYGYYMTSSGQFLSRTNETIRDNWNDFLNKVQEIKSEPQAKLGMRNLAALPRAGSTVYVDQNYSIPTASWDYSSGIHDQGYYAKRDANGGMLWCVAPGNPLNFGANSGYGVEERDQQNLVIASLIAYWGYETQQSVANAFYTERHIQNMGTGVESFNIQDSAGIVSQAGYNAWVKETNRKINSYLTKPSFENQKYTLKKGETIRIDDTNSSLWAYTVSANNTNMNASIDGNTLVVKATGDVKDGAIRLKYNISPAYEGATILYTHPYSQEVIKAGVNDPRYLNVNFEVQKEGKLKIKKVDDTGKALPGVEIKLTANGKSTTSKTNASGELESPLYDIGTVVEYEETATIAGHYIDAATSKGKVTLKEGTNTVTIKNPRYANLTLIKKNDAGVAMDGVVFKLTADGKSEEYTTKDGKFDIKNKFKDGTVVEYEEIKTIPGHYIDPKTSKGSITVKSGENTINVKNPRYANLTLVKKNDKGEPMDGVTFKLTADGKSEEYTTKDGGLIDVKNKYKDGTKVDWEEIKTIKGHYIDPEKSKGSITVKSGENTLNVENPTLNFGVSSQASNQDGAQFVNPMQGQKLRDEVMIQANQAPANAKVRIINDLVEFGTGKQLGEESLQQIIEFEAKNAQFVKFVDREFDATDMHGKKAVHTNILEYYNPSTEEWEEVARDDDLNNEAQSIQFVHPTIHTEFFFYDHEGNETKITDPLKKVKGYDRVYFENLISGQTYKFDLTMMNRETGKEFLDPNGNKVTGMIEIVAGEDGEVTSSISAKEYYENLAKEADEKDGDKEDKEESTDKEDSKDPSETEIKPLAEGEEEANSEENTETEETEDPTEFSTLNEVVLLTGHVDVPFEADLSAANGNILVAYEQVSTNDTPVAEHKDIEDEKQSGKVRNPELNTKALVNGVKEVTEDGKLVLEDTVEYSDLTPGVEYEQTVVWMVKNNGEALKIKQKEVTGTVKFTPEKEDGEVTVKVVIDGKELFENYGDTVDLVAFEETTREGEKIAEHKDINDEGQTVRINKPVVPATPKRTLPQTSGSESNSTAWIMLALVIVVGAFLVFVNKKREKK
jgi:LPXTG-motif cell wall-anchored protein